MRIALINPCSHLQLQTHRHGVGHLGLGYVAACLLKNGHDVCIIDAKNEKLDPDAVVGRIREFAPALVGATAMTHEICHVGDLLAKVKQALPTCITVVGGPHTTALPEHTLQEFPDIDVAVCGEGEYTACELAEAISANCARGSWASIQGIAFRDSDGVRMTQTRPPIDNLDDLPFPAWELFPRDVLMPIFSGRGCPFRCAFCQRVLGDRIRLRSVDSVIAELDARETRIDRHTFWFSDEVFGTNRKWTRQLLERLIRRNERLGRVWHWKANSRTNLADEELYRLMHRAGCRQLDFGIESGCLEILDRIHKNITLETAREAIRCARRASIKTNAFFIIGHPGENWRTALKTVRFARRLGADDIAVGVMVPYPGTEVWEMARRGEWGYKLLTRDWSVYDKYFGQAIELRDLSSRQLELLQVLTYVWFYAGTGRFRRLAAFLWQFRCEARHMLDQLISLPNRRQLKDDASGTHPAPNRQPIDGVQPA